MFQLGFDAEVFGLVFAADYKAKVLAREKGRWTLGTVEKILEKVLSFCNNLSFNKYKMLKEFLFTGSENATGEVMGSDRDAGSSIQLSDSPST
ncbi:serine/threonine-protein kinase 19-like [Oncorhynchus mykiss]|uniref:serine/threonine-protein kinase 19-like n=1 Tax=Oncorhynchus mykiss TaxID=8022 RepID=UPI000B4E862B|nr:serine/threonine-protein kinase 19-like [Oncorhynchus mykiss]